MTLKIEIVQNNQNHPPFLVLNDGANVYPIVDIQFSGRTDVKRPNLQEPFNLLSGYILFKDVFGCQHKISCDEQKATAPAQKAPKNKHPESDRDRMWQRRIDALREQARKLGRPFDDNPLKNLPPWFWNDVPETDLPEWMRMPD